MFSTHITMMTFGCFTPICQFTNNKMEWMWYSLLGSGKRAYNVFRNISNRIISRNTSLALWWHQRSYEFELWANNYITVFSLLYIMHSLSLFWLFTSTIFVLELLTLNLVCMLNSCDALISFCYSNLEREKERKKERYINVF